MTHLPSYAHRPARAGLQQIAAEYQHRYASRVQRTRVSGAALLLAAITHALLTAALVANVVNYGIVFPSIPIATYLGVTACVFPVTLFLARLYAQSRMSAQLARAQLLELGLPL